VEYEDARFAMNKVNLTEKLAQFTELCSPRIVGELNGQHVKVVKLAGEFIWHHHENEDELFPSTSRHRPTAHTFCCSSRRPR
jgi:hypothetical protein